MARLVRLYAPILALLTATAPLTAQYDNNTGAPLSVIDWLDTQAPPPTRRAAEVPDEPAVATSASTPRVTVTPLGEGRPREIGLVPSELTGLPKTLWTGSDAATLIARIDALPDLRLPAAQSLLYTVLLAEAQAPGGEAGAGDTLALARVRKLVELGALDPALSLIEQTGVATSPAHFDLWMQISLLLGIEDRACAVLRGAAHLTRDYGTRIFCAARAGAWDNAALTFGSAQALGLMPPEKLALLDRFLNPDLFEGEAPLPAPRRMDPLSFRLFETIGERKPTGALARSYAVADLRDVAGWKAQLEAAERLTRAGALPDNRLLGLYTERKAAASGGIWDRVAALQRFETALGTGSAEAVAKTLPSVWRQMQAARLGTAFAALFAEQLAEVPLEGPVARIALDVGLMSPLYEATAQQAADDPETALLRGVAIGETRTARPQDTLAAAIHDAFSGAVPLPAAVQVAREGKLGQAILDLIVMMEDGAAGDAKAMRDALAGLRALGLEDTARRAALQTLLMER